MIYSENQLNNFSEPLSKTEDEKCMHAIQEVRDALQELGFKENEEGITTAFDDTPSYRTKMQNYDTKEFITIFLQGSYANNTNIKAESDVDVAVVKEMPFNVHYRTTQPSPQSDDTFNFVNAKPEYVSFKDRVEECLDQRFPGQVQRHNKSIKVKGNTYRKDADTVPASRYRNYVYNYSNDPDEYIGGILIKSDQNEIIVNYPEQHIIEGRKKNVATNHAYKRQVRIMKSINKEMENFNYSTATNMSSFGLESLTWNIPDEVFNRYTSLRYVFGEVVKYLSAHTQDFASYKEANGIKLLCTDYDEVRKYKEFVNDLSTFYEYEV